MIIPAGFCELTFNFEGNGLAFPGAVVLGVDQGGGATPEATAENAHNSMKSTIMLHLNDDVALVSTNAKFGPNATGPSALFTDTAEGGNTAAGASSQCAYLVRKNTTLGGKKGKGRMYLPGVTESVIGSDGAIDPIFGALLQAEITEFGQALVLLSMPPVVLHTDATAPTPVTTMQLQSVIGTQRRRLRR